MPSALLSGHGRRLVTGTDRIRKLLYLGNGLLCRHNCRMCLHQDRPRLWEEKREYCRGEEIKLLQALVG